MGLVGVEVDTVANLKHKNLLVKGNFQSAFGNNIKFLTIMRVLVELGIIGQRVDLNEERVDLTASEATRQTLASVAFAALNGRSLVATGKEIRVHVGDRKSTRLNSSHANISYAVFCL